MAPPIKTSPSRRGPAWMVQAAALARRFHLDGRSKTELAEEFGLSRFKVARMLEEARELGVVDVTITLPTHIDADLSTTLGEQYGLRRAIVVDVPTRSDVDVRSQLGAVAADLLGELVSADEVLGLSCSRTVAAATEALTTLAPCTVVQLTGTLAGPDIAAGSVESVRRAAAIGGGQGFPIYGPMLLPDAATARALAGESAIRATIEQFGRVGIAMVAIGAWRDDLSTVWTLAEERARRAATKAGAVGEIGGRLFDASGNPVATELDERILGITLDQLRRVPEVIGLMYDARRADAARAALLGGLVDTFVTDASLARALVEEAAA
ncbi:MAG TPA: sugar-binding domain-containing protein [Nocardioidaceae bacterium]|nr:sugar-binding domain-containing protein [Nocardioidaceae bacterium]